jgi:hypothetical protein
LSSALTSSVPANYSVTAVIEPCNNRVTAV